MRASGGVGAARARVGRAITRAGAWSRLLQLLVERRQRAVERRRGAGGGGRRHLGGRGTGVERHLRGGGGGGRWHLGGRRLGRGVGHAVVRFVLALASRHRSLLAHRVQGPTRFRVDGRRGRRRRSGGRPGGRGVRRAVARRRRRPPRAVRPLEVGGRDLVEVVLEAGRAASSLLVDGRPVVGVPSGGPAIHRPAHLRGLPGDGRRAAPHGQRAGGHVRLGEREEQERDHAHRRGGERPPHSTSWQVESVFSPEGCSRGKQSATPRQSHECVISLYCSDP